jgi:hypothetical protein
LIVDTEAARAWFIPFQVAIHYDKRHQISRSKLAGSFCFHRIRPDDHAERARSIKRTCCHVVVIKVRADKRSIIIVTMNVRHADVSIPAPVPNLPLYFRDELAFSLTRVDGDAPCAHGKMRAGALDTFNDRPPRRIDTRGRLPTRGRYPTQVDDPVDDVGS